MCSFYFWEPVKYFIKKGSHEWKEVKSKDLLLTVNPEKGEKKKKKQK